MIEAGAQLYVLAFSHNGTPTSSPAISSFSQSDPDLRPRTAWQHKRRNILRLKLNLKMLRAFPSRSALVARARCAGSCNLSSSATKASSHQPNAPIDLDPSLRTLLNDVDLSLLKHRARHAMPSSHMELSHRELEVVPHQQNPGVDYLTSEELDVLQDREDGAHRKSPAALFGSQQIGAVVIPSELQKAVNLLIAGTWTL